MRSVLHESECASTELEPGTIWCIPTLVQMSHSSLILQILRWVKGYDKQKRLFLPPVTPGGKLPEEVLQAWQKEQQKSRPSDKDLAISGSEMLNITVNEFPGGAVDQGSQSQLKLLPVLSTDMLQQSGALEGKTPQPSTTALLSVPELAVIESVLDLSSQITGGLSQVDISEFDASPVATAIARYMGVDLSPEGVMAEIRKGIAIIVHGPPQSGCTSQAQALAKRYNAGVVNIAALLKDVISYASTPAGYNARKFCIDAEKVRQTQMEPASPVPTIAGKKTTGKESKDKEQTTAVQEDTSPVLEPFTVQPLEDTEVAVPESTLLPAVLPDDLLVEILSERLQETDCRQGMVFDGIECPFTADPSAALKVILKAINNRKHIYVVQIKMEFTDIRNRKKELQEEAKRKAIEEEQKKEELKRQEEEQVRRQLEMDEEEYEALSEEKRKEIDDKLLEIKKAKRLQKQKEREEKERLERERENEEKRLAEEMKKKKGKGKKPTALGATMSPSRPVSAIRELPGQSSTSAALAEPSQASVTSTLDTPAPLKRKAQRTSAKQTGLVEEVHIESNSLNKKYQYYQQNLEAVLNTCQDWDRVAGVERRKPEEELQKPSTPGKKLWPKLSSMTLKTPDSPTPPLASSPVNREGLGVRVIAVNGILSEDALSKDICENLPAPEEV